MASADLPPRWTSLRPHDVQTAWMRSPARFNVVPAGRRSGKTERAKRKLVRHTLRGPVGRAYGGKPRYFAAAPTREQAKRIYWSDLKALMPRDLVVDISETELRIDTKVGELQVVGMDKPERIEGSPWDGGILDEYGNMKAQAWRENVRPALSDRQGWCDMIGVPEGRNHYFDLYQTAGETDGWARFTWPSADILPPEEVDAARRELDELTFAQEYEASFVSFEGRCYYPFSEDVHCERDLATRYNPTQPLAICFDFNVAPGVAAIVQEFDFGTAVIGEVYIPRNSNTPAVCRKILADWGNHAGNVTCYGDATGGARGTAAVAGSDWDIVKDSFRNAWGGRARYDVPKANPPERSRVNAVNSRLRASDGTVRLKVDPKAAPNVVRDLEGVTLLEGGSGEIDKKADASLSHISDALGYYIAKVYPVRSAEVKTQRLVGI